MFSNVSHSALQPSIPYPTLDSTLPFSNYIDQCRAMIQERRANFGNDRETAIKANCPFELYPNEPSASGQSKYGAILIHGLLDSPFSMRDIGHHLQAQGILNRAILLPGHGTNPSDLLSVSYRDWIESVRYGIESLQNQVDHLFLIGYSTGAALAIHHALKHDKIKGIILLSPAIRIKAPVSIVVGWHKLVKCFTRNHYQWLYKESERDYAKYQSIPFRAIKEVARLTHLIQSQLKKHTLNIPIFAVMSLEDETISATHAIDFFLHHASQESKLLLYAAAKKHYADPRILVQEAYLPELHINHYAHSSLPFAPGNPHYGARGDAPNAAHQGEKEVVYGAYNRIEQRCRYLLYQAGLSKNVYRELSYNPTFKEMADKITRFIVTT